MYLSLSRAPRWSSSPDKHYSQLGICVTIVELYTALFIYSDIHETAGYKIKKAETNVTVALKPIPFVLKFLVCRIT